ncbi:hypothetical protein BDV18DRAFT_158337 [Aspergillus unguis]
MGNGIEHDLNLSLNRLSPSVSYHLSPSPSPAAALNCPSKSSPALSSPIYPGLSLHRYRKSLSCGHGSGLLQDYDFGNNNNWKGKKLRRKNAAVNLTATATAQMGSLYQYQHLHSPHNAYYQITTSSVTSSSPPPPLSPSYSPSSLSEQSELLDPLSPLVDGHYRCESEGLGHKHNYKLLDTFRDRLEKFPDPETPDIVELYGHSRTRSDSALFKTRRARKPPVTATVVHQGTSFEILNPHESLDFARIVSYIDDVDCHSASIRRNSYIYSNDDADIILNSEDLTCGPSDEVPTPNKDERAHDDLVGDSPHHPMPSISERLQDSGTESCYSSMRAPSRPLSMVTQSWPAHNESDLGEPGPPIYHDEELPSQTQRPFPCTPPPDLGLDLTPAELAALYNIGNLPAPGKGTDNPTAVIYSDLKPLRKRSTIKKSRNRNRTRKVPPSTSSFSLKPSAPASASAAAPTASAPLKRLRGIAQTLRRKTFQRTSVSS